MVPLKCDGFGELLFLCGGDKHILDSQHCSPKGRRLEPETGGEELASGQGRCRDNFLCAKSIGCEGTWGSRN
jgi:hypothetical protein